MTTELWICGKHMGETENGAAWEFQGVHSTKAAAIAACRTEDYFIGPSVLDQRRPHNSHEWEGAYYPMLEPEKN